MKQLCLVKLIFRVSPRYLRQQEMKLVEFTKEGLIIHALMSGALRYKDLKRTTGISDAWLSKKLQELLKLGIVVLQDGNYSIDAGKLQEALKNEKPFIARLVAQEIAKRNDVLAIVLFGSLVRDSSKEGDIDLLVVTTEEEFNPIRVSLEMFRMFGVAVDIVHLTFEDLLKWFYEKPPILFGILSGYEILFDKGYFQDLLKTLKKEVLKNWVYLEREELWLRKELLPRT